MLATARALDRAHRSLAASREEVRRLRLELEALGEATRAVSDAIAELPRSDVHALLHTIVLQGRSLTHAAYGAIGIGSDPSRPFDPWVQSGMSEEQVRAIGRTPCPVGLLGRIALDGEIIRSRDLTEEPGFEGLPPGHPPLRSLLGVPIPFAGKIVGNFYLAEKEGGAEFTLEDQHLIEALAARAGHALATARAFRKEARERTWLQSVIDQMPEGVIVLDRHGHISHINRAGHAYVLPPRSPGLDPFGNPLMFDLRQPNGEELPFEQWPVVRALSTRETVVGCEILLEHSDGRLVPVLANASAIQDGSEEPGGAVVVFQDITPLKDLERMREEWTSIVAHDLRQPVSVISLAAALLESMEIPDEEAQRTLARLSRASSGLERMICDLVDASRIESRRLTLTTEPVDTKSTLLEIVDQAAPTLRGHVDSRIAAGLPKVIADRGRLEQIVTNLLSNAAKYGDGKSDILLVAKAIDDHVEIAVMNRGRGLGHEELARVFDRYYRTPGSSRTREGLGLGLYIVKGLVEAHGGRITAESVPGETTTFRFTLPCHAEARAAETAERPLPATPGKGAHRD